MVCVKAIKVPKGIFCANFCHLRHDNKICKSLWCPPCYRSHPDDMFHVNKPVDEAGIEWTQKKYQGRFQSEIPRDSLFTTTQYKI